MPIAQELPIDTTATALEMAQTIFGPGTTIVSASYTGDARSSGIYTNGDTIAPEATPADSGIILSTGKVVDYTNNSGTTNTNTSTTTSTNTHGLNNDPDFNAIAGVRTYDAAVLEVSFIPDGDLITLDFIMGSEEYPEWVNSQYNDVIGVWVNGSQATASFGTGNISIGDVNAGDTPNLFRDNTGDQYNTEMDGLTVTLSLTAPVIPGEVNTIRIGVADAGDSIYDTNFLIAANSVQTALVAQDDTVNMGLNSSKVIDVLANDSTTSGGTLHVTKINDVAVSPGDTVTLTTGQQVTLNPDGTLTVQSDGDIETINFNYTVEDTLTGKTNSAIVNVNQMACFVHGTLIDTTEGPRRVETLSAGDLVLTRDHGPQPLLWVGAATVPGSGNMAPVRIRKGALGATRDVLVSPQHRILIRNELCDIAYGEPELLIPAKALADGVTAEVLPMAEVTYYHLLFETHQIITSSGIESESFQPAAASAGAFDEGQRMELIRLFPDLFDLDHLDMPAARPALKVTEARGLMALMLSA